MSAGPPSTRSGPEQPAVPERIAGRFRLGIARSPETLRAALSASIIGQEHAVDAVIRALTISAAGIRDFHRPIASLLLTGPTGVGKTELARRLAAEIAGDQDWLCRIDMNSLAQEHYAAAFSGAPPGYSGAKEQFTLFDRELVEGNTSRPGIVLFDEIEKAHITVLRGLLQILDSGRLRLSAGTSSIDFRNSIVLLTSNLGTAEFTRRISPSRPAALRHWSSSAVARLRPRRLDLRKSRGAEAAEDRIIEEFFDPELYNRFDEVIRFHPIDSAKAHAIVELELRQLAHQLAAENIVWEPSEDIIEFLSEVGFHPRYGARHLARAIRSRLCAPIAETIVAQDDQGPMHITTRVHSGVIIAVKE